MNFLGIFGIIKTEMSQGIISELSVLEFIQRNVMGDGWQNARTAVSVCNTHPENIPGHIQ